MPEAIVKSDVLPDEAISADEDSKFNSLLEGMGRQYAAASIGIVFYTPTIHGEMSCDGADVSIIQVVETQEGDTTVAKVVGTQIENQEEIAALEACLSELLKQPGVTLCIDMSTVERMSSAFLGKIYQWNTQVQRNGGKLQFRNLSQDLQIVFGIMRLSNLVIS